jgi:hypothetical protein
VHNINDLIERDLEGLDPVARVRRITELIEFYGRDVTAELARMRAEETRSLLDDMTPAEVAAGVNISPSRLRKLADR